MRQSRPPRARGLKLVQGLLTEPATGVAPPAGAWIETGSGQGLPLPGRVAPPAGAWIETGSRPMAGPYVRGRAPRGRVD